MSNITTVIGYMISIVIGPGFDIGDLRGLVNAPQAYEDLNIAVLGGDTYEVKAVMPESISEPTCRAAIKCMSIRFEFKAKSCFTPSRDFYGEITGPNGNIQVEEHFGQEDGWNVYQIISDEWFTGPFTIKFKLKRCEVVS